MESKSIKLNNYNANWSVLEKAEIGDFATIKIPKNYRHNVLDAVGMSKEHQAKYLVSRQIDGKYREVPRSFVKATLLDIQRFGGKYGSEKNKDVLYTRLHNNSDPSHLCEGADKGNHTRIKVCEIAMIYFAYGPVYCAAELVHLSNGQCPIVRFFSKREIEGISRSIPFEDFGSFLKA